MLLKDLAVIYTASKQIQKFEMTTREVYTGLRSFFANLQYMSNEEEQKTFGKITNSVIVIRASNPIELNIGDGIYLSEPTEANGTYGEPDYHILTLKTAYIGVVTVRNPVVIKARKNNNAENRNQAQRRP